VEFAQFAEPDFLVMLRQSAGKVTMQNAVILEALLSPPIQPLNTSTSEVPR